MLIDFQQLIKTYDMNITGVIHVGAHYGQEYAHYKDANIQDVVFIEPCKKAFKQLVSNVGLEPGVICINKACGLQKDRLTMHVETANTGMSNSLLKPALHTAQYPDIRFTDTEDVDVDTLDSILYNLLYKLDMEDMYNPYNTLVMDVQGYEHHVLRGAPVVLHNIDYIYTEVNRAELYEGCARVETLDSFLTEFTRAHTNWGGRTWGDALYVHKSLMVKPV